MTWRKMTGTSAVFDLDAGATKTAAAGVDGWYQSQLALRAEYERRALGRSVATPEDRFAQERQAINAELERLKAAGRRLTPADRARIVG